MNEEELKAMVKLICGREMDSMQYTRIKNGVVTHYATLIWEGVLSNINVANGVGPTRALAWADLVPKALAWAERAAKRAREVERNRTKFRSNNGSQR